MAGFEHVLKKLVEDPKYRETVVKDTHQLRKDYDLSAEELTLLMQVWVNSDPTARLSIWDLCHCCCGFSASRI
jgi:hypothetical protein